MLFWEEGRGSCCFVRREGGRAVLGGGKGQGRM